MTLVYAFQKKKEKKKIGFSGNLGLLSKKQLYIFIAIKHGLFRFFLSNRKLIFFSDYINLYLDLRFLNQ